MAIPNKHKGKSFAEIANTIQEKYKNRYDSVSIKGLNKEIQDLQSAQEYERAKMKIQEQIQANQNAEAQQGQQPQQGGMEQMQAPPQQANNQGIGFNPSQPQETFKRQASSDYNEKFANGGMMTNQYLGGGYEDMDSFVDQLGSLSMQPISISKGQMIMPKGQMIMPKGLKGVDLSENYKQQGALGAGLGSGSGFFNDPQNQMKMGLGLMAAPLVGNLIQSLTAKPAADVPVRTISNQGISALKNFRARESRFDNIDLDNVERGITEASGRFTQNNVNASRGNAGAFVANELGNQSNLYRAIGDARMKGQIADRETSQLNAAEKARADALNLQAQSQAAGLQGRNDMFNAQMLANADIQNAQNEAAAQSFKSDTMNSALSGLSAIGSTLFGAGQAGEATDYDIFGNFLGGDNEARYGGNQYAQGGMINPNCGQPGQPPCMDISGDNRARDKEGYLKPPSLYTGEEKPKRVDRDKVSIAIDKADPSFETKEEFDAYYSEKALDKMLKSKSYNPDISLEDNLVLYAELPDYDLYSKKSKDKKKGKVYSGYGGDGVDPMSKVQDKKKFQKALKKIRKKK